MTCQSGTFLVVGLPRARADPTENVRQRVQMLFEVNTPKRVISRTKLAVLLRLSGNKIPWNTRELSQKSKKFKNFPPLQCCEIARTRSSNDSFKEANSKDAARGTP